MAKDNTSLGQFNLEGIPPAPRGVPQIEVTFDIDANGIINVSAKDLGTNKEQKITITATTKLPKEEIDKMIKEAEAHAEEDRKIKQQIEIKNDADALVYTTEKTLGEYGDKIDKNLKDRIENKLKELKEAIAKEDYTQMKTKSEELSKEIQEIGKEIYSKVQKQENKKNEKKVETEFKDEKKD